MVVDQSTWTVNLASYTTGHLDSRLYNRVVDQPSISWTPRNIGMVQNNYSEAIVCSHRSG